MKKNKYYYIFILTISFFIILNFTSFAAEDVFVSNDRNFFDEITKKTQDQAEELIDKAQDKAKQAIKEKIKTFIRNKIEWTKNILNPLKIKIQQGSDIIREEVNRVKNYLKDLF